MDGHLHPAVGLSENTRGRRESQERALFTTKIRLCADIHSATENESLFLRRMLWNDFKRFVLITAGTTEHKTA